MRYFPGISGIFGSSGVLSQSRGTRQGVLLTRTARLSEVTCEQEVAFTGTGGACRGSLAKCSICQFVSLSAVVDVSPSRVLHATLGNDFLGGPKNFSRLFCQLNERACCEVRLRRL